MSQINSATIAALKAATLQVARPASSEANFDSPIVMSLVAPTIPGGHKQKSQFQSTPASENFAEAFVGKITSVEQEKVEIEKEQLVVDQELSRAEQLRLDLITKKKQLENRRNELIAVKDKLAALDKELSEVLKAVSPL